MPKPDVLAIETQKPAGQSAKFLGKFIAERRDQIMLAASKLKRA
jgi:hypothetical protein